MIDLDTLFDFIDTDASNHTHTHSILTQSKTLHPSNTNTTSRVYCWYKRLDASVRHHRFVPSSLSLPDLQRWGRKEQRTAVALCAIYILLWLHGLSVGAMSARASSNDRSNDSNKNNNGVEFLCDGQRRYYHTVPSELASVPTVADDDVQRRKGVSGPTLIAKPWIEHQISERENSEQQRSLATRIVQLLSFSPTGSAWTRLCNVGLAVLTALVVHWCSTAEPLESKEEEKQQGEEEKVFVPWSHETRPCKASKEAQKSPTLSQAEKKADEKDASRDTRSSPAVAQQQASLTSTKITDTEVISLGMQDRIRLYSLETVLGDAARAVKIRRQIVAGKVRSEQRPSSSSLNLNSLPSKDYDYSRVVSACCENVIGYTTVPVGVAGPLKIDGKQVFIPMATTEGALVASTNRGCSAINASGGVVSVVLGDGMTRGPCLRFPNLERAGAAKLWLDTAVGFRTLETAFNSTTRFGRLLSTKSVVAGSDVFVRFKASTGDAMGMNIISKGVEMALASMKESGFHDMRVLSLSGNYCTDKKAAAINWIDGRGKSVSAQATISEETLKKVLKVDVDRMLELNTSKNLVGSCLAGSVGGSNAHAANLVAAIFLATGQDIAQVVESSSCLTTMQK